jgi:hypothetical protein
MYLDINLEKCVLPAHIKSPLSDIVSRGNKLPCMYFYGSCTNEMETTALAIAKSANLLPIKITPKKFPNSKQRSQTRNFLKELEQLLNTLTIPLICRIRHHAVN